MSYHLITGWTTVVEEDYDSLTGAIERADDLVRLHPQAVVQVNGEGLTLSRYTVESEVSA